MLLIEADGKALFRAAGLRVPDGALVAAAGEWNASSVPTPWIVKAQVPVGGRGKAGGIVRCADDVEVRNALDRLLQSRIKGHTVQRCLVERAVQSDDEWYLSLMIDPAARAVRVTLLREGGVDVESVEVSGRSRLCDPEASEIVAAVRELASGEAAARQRAITDVAERLAGLFLQRELMLAEINPLFFDAHGAIAADARVVIDLDALARQPELMALVERHAELYPDAMRKLRDGFDYVEVDPDGEIGLLTTGAGLSMMLIDELTERGGRPLNFCDIRTGLLRGDPKRVLRVLEWISARGSVKVLLVNVFAGVTDLAEFAALLCAALEQTPSLRVPVVARIVGNGFDRAKALLATRRPDILVEEDMDRALAQVDRLLQRGAQ